ncbi:hypothetical protein Dsin_005967 [Dipteronia sinensis]|uniref:DUF4283 domain-containing protein n=1 Tax=Dipteronia sinensis TaxID=43782 RepID=A0AAE0EGZ8_9ROSI|nr:hypothetical protein Dsin_005967 [Dipteronia sinensis]
MGVYNTYTLFGTNERWMKGGGWREEVGRRTPIHCLVGEGKMRDLSSLKAHQNASFAHGTDEKEERCVLENRLEEGQHYPPIFHFVFMDLDEIAPLCESFSRITKEEKLLSVLDNLKESAGKKLDLCLVGKLLSTKHVNKEAFRQMILRIWQTRHDIEVVQDNMFLFNFRNQRDRLKILAGGPWNFDNCLFVFDKLKEVGDIANMSFHQVEFWIQVHNVPFLCMTKDMGKFLGQLISDLVDINLGSMGECFGHSHWECPKGRDEDNRKIDLEFEFGPWLRASSPPGQSRAHGNDIPRINLSCSRGGGRDNIRRGTVTHNRSDGVTLIGSVLKGGMKTIGKLIWSLSLGHGCERQVPLANLGLIGTTFQE